jgi:hypothetical protein
MILAIVVFAILAQAHAANVRDTVDVQLVTDEADSVVAVANRVAVGSALSSADLEHLAGTIGFRHLQERQARFGGALADSTMAAFVNELAASGRFAAYREALRRLEGVNVASAAKRASAYLPRGTTLRARLYFEIKPHANSFVFTGSDSLPSIFLSVQPENTPKQAMNTLAHELHHIGVASACREAARIDTSRVTPPVATLLEFLSAFGEGRAMLAAAGGPDVHPHAADPDSIRKRWDRDVLRAPADIAELSSFAEAVLDGRITTVDSVTNRGMSYFGVQGPWYTVGWLMSSTVERVQGRPALIASTCNPVDLLSTYNDAVARLGARRRLPSWPADLVRRLRAADITM